MTSSGHAFGRERPLRLGGGLDSGDRLRECREERVALGSDGDTAVRGDCPADQLEMSPLTSSQRAPSARASAIEPSTSVRRKVTVPVGRSLRPRSGRTVMSVR